MNDVQAAADRLRKHAEAYAAAQDAPTAKVDEILAGSPYFYGGSQTRWASVMMTCDYETLAKAYLSLDPASLPRPDDGDGISAEWLERCGARDPYCGTTGDIKLFDLNSRTSLEVSLRNGQWVATMWFCGDGNSRWVELPQRLRTRGDLRKLCVGLRITLKEAE